MGRFYKTGKGDYIDFIYKQPRNLLLQAVKTAEGQIDQQAKLNADLYGQLHSQALSPDVGKRDEILAGYKSQIDTTAQNIMDDPLAYRRSSTGIRKLSDDISQNLQRGELAAFESNVATRDQFKKDLQEQVKAKDITLSEMNTVLSNYDSSFSKKGGTSYSGPQQYQQYQSGFLDKNVEIYDYVDKRAKDIKANVIAANGWGIDRDGKGNEYLVTTSGGKKRVTAARVQAAVANALNNDPLIQNAWWSRNREGIAGYDTKGIQDKFTSAVNYAVNKYAFEEDNRSTSVKGDPYFKLEFANNLKNRKPPIMVKKGDVIVNKNPGGAGNPEDAAKAVTKFEEGFQGEFKATNGLVLEDVEKNIITELQKNAPEGYTVAVNPQGGSKYIYFKEGEGEGKSARRFEVGGKMGVIKYIKENDPNYSILNKHTAQETALRLAGEDAIATGDWGKYQELANDLGVNEGAKASIQTLANSYTSENVNEVNNYKANLQTQIEGLKLKMSFAEYKKKISPNAGALDYNNAIEKLAKQNLYDASFKSTEVYARNTTGDSWQMQKASGQFTESDLGHFQTWLKGVDDLGLSSFLVPEAVTVEVFPENRTKANTVKGQLFDKAIKDGTLLTDFTKSLLEGTTDKIDPVTLDPMIDDMGNKIKVQTWQYTNGRETYHVAEQDVMLTDDNIEGTDNSLKKVTKRWTASMIGPNGVVEERRTFDTYVDAGEGGLISADDTKIVEMLKIDGASQINKITENINSTIRQQEQLIKSTNQEVGATQQLGDGLEMTVGKGGATEFKVGNQILDKKQASLYKYKKELEKHTPVKNPTTNK